VAAKAGAGAPRCWRSPPRSRPPGCRTGSPAARPTRSPAGRPTRTPSCRWTRAGALAGMSDPPPTARTP
jgi:hypothetical protein